LPKNSPAERLFILFASPHRGICEYRRGQLVDSRIGVAFVLVLAIASSPFRCGEASGVMPLIWRAVE
jgi:hypothetical protein